MKKTIAVEGVTYFLVPVPQKVETVTPWSACGFKPSTAKALIDDGVTHLEKVFECSEFALLHVPGIGRKTFHAIKYCIEERYPGRHIGDLVAIEESS